MNLGEAVQALREAQAEVDRLTLPRKRLENQLEEIRRRHMEAQAKVADLKVQVLNLAIQEDP